MNEKYITNSLFHDNMFLLFRISIARYDIFQVIVAALKIVSQRFTGWAGQRQCFSIFLKEVSRHNIVSPLANTTVYFGSSGGVPATGTYWTFCQPFTNTSGMVLMSTVQLGCCLLLKTNCTWLLNCLKDLTD